MAFGFSDLMVQVLPGAGGGGDAAACPQGTVIGCGCTGHTQCWFGTCGPCSLGCTHCSNHCTAACSFCSNHCTFGCTICSNHCTFLSPRECIAGTIPPIGPNCGGSIDPGPGVVRPEDLATLREHLQQTLAQVEQQQRVVEESMRPQTVEQVDQLEQRLTAALEEVKTRREELQRRSAEGKG